MLHPETEWEAVATEKDSRKAIFARFVAPFMLLLAIATVIGTWLSVSRELYSTAYVLCTISVLWASLVAGLFFSTFAIGEIMAQRAETGDRRKSFALMAYSSGAAYLTIFVVSLFPFFNELYVLAFYSFYLYWRGIPHLIRIDGQKQLAYGLVSFFIVLLSYSLMFFFFRKTLGAIFDILPNT